MDGSASFCGNLFIIELAKLELMTFPPPPADAPIIANMDVTGGNRSPVYGEPMTLVCPLQSNPPAEYAWKRYSIDGSQSLNISTDVKFTEGGQRMEMVAYRPDLHNGLYVCEASNSLGSKEYRNSNRFLLSTTCKYERELLIL